MISEKEMEIIERAVKVSAYSDEDALLILKGLVIEKNMKIEDMSHDILELNEEIGYVAKENAHLIGVIKKRDEEISFLKKTLERFEGLGDDHDTD